MAVQAVPSARTFASSQHGVPAHNHDAHQQIFPGFHQTTANQGQQVHVEADSSVSVLVCQVIKVSAGHPVPQPAPAVQATPPIATGSPSIVVSSQEALSNLTTRVRTATMHLTAVFAVLAFAMAVQAVPMARTFASSQHGVPAHNHDAHQQIFPGFHQTTANQGQQVHVEADSSVSVLVCQVIKVPAGHPVPQPAPAVQATSPIATGSPSIVVSSQEALSNLTTRVRTAGTPGCHYAFDCRVRCSRLRHGRASCPFGQDIRFIATWRSCSQPRRSSADLPRLSPDHR
ncbi:hypothetical protein MTO96_001617 [Rhipicephalus appendiculatus]